MASEKKGAVKVKRAGRKKLYIARYYLLVYGPRKEKRILKHNGPRALAAYKKHKLDLLIGEKGVVKFPKEAR